MHESFLEEDFTVGTNECISLTVFVCHFILYKVTYCFKSFPFRIFT